MTVFRLPGQSSSTSTNELALGLCSQLTITNLTKLEETFSGIRNYNVAVKEWNDDIVFLHKIVAGSADKSYGIHVAKLAGVPDWVNRRASKILAQLESSQPDSPDLDQVATKANQQIQLTLFGETTHPLIDKIKKMDTNHVTPMSALELLQTVADRAFWQQAHPLLAAKSFRFRSHVLARKKSIG